MTPGIPTLNSLYTFMSSQSPLVWLSAVLTVVGALSAWQAIMLNWLRKRTERLDYALDREYRGRETHGVGRSWLFGRDEPTLVDIYKQLERIEDRFQSLSAFQERLSNSTSSSSAELSSHLVELERRLASLQDRFGDVNILISEAQHHSSVGTKDAGVATSKLVREVSHTLFTPLSRIDAISRTIMADPQPIETLKAIRSIQSAASICVLYLQAFRALSHLAVGATTQSASFSEALSAAADLYLEAASKEVTCEVRAPNRLSKVPEHILFASILPLVENAVDEARGGDSIVIEVSETPTLVTASVSNPAHRPLPANNLFEDGFTDKAGSTDGSRSRVHEGLGLGIVKNLVEAMPGGTVKYESRDGVTDFTISVPATP